MADWHIWLEPGEEPNFSPWTCCRNCGVIQRKDGKNQKPCPGVVKIALRSG